MLTKLLRQILFILVHLVVSGIVALENAYYRFWIKRGSFHSDQVTKNDIRTTLQLVPRLSKKLKHLVMMADTKHHSMSDLARLIIWSLVAGVPYVSFHDITGELKENEDKLFLEVEKKKKGIPGCIKWAKKPDLNGYTNGNQAHTVFVHIVTVADGREIITECVKDITKGKLPINSHSTQFTAQEFDEVLNLRYPSIPDPDLVLYTGSLCCTYGLLPWQIRLTEFMQLSLDHRVDIESFVYALGKYDKCDQRFGK